MLRCFSSADTSTARQVHVFVERVMLRRAPEILRNLDRSSPSEQLHFTSAPIRQKNALLIFYVVKPVASQADRE
jgi:hypothetical protein